MERRYSSQQDGSCVDPLWDPFSTDHVKALVRRESPSTDDNASRKSTPLTPQEFELLSDSNPFKQDIAEKYGLAYPGITTKSQSHDLLHRSKGFLDSDELFDARTRRKSTNDADSYSETSQKGLRGRKCFKDSSYAFTGLNDFLLKNQQSIEDSIQKLSDSDADLTRLQRKEFLLKNQKSIEESIQRLENFEKLFPLSKQVVIHRLDEVDVLNTSSGDHCTGRQIPDLLPRDEHINPVGFSGDFRGSVKPCDDLIDLTPDDGDPSRPADQQKRVTTTSVAPPDPISTGVRAPGHGPDPSSRKSYADDGGQTTEVRPLDPYSSIRFEDYNRKQDQSKSLSEGQTSASSDDSFDIPPLLTRSLDIGKSPGFIHGKNSFIPVTAVSNDTPVSNGTAPLFDIAPPVYQIKDVTSILELNYSTINEDKDVSVTVIGDEVQAPTAVLTISGDSIDFHFGSSLEETGDSPTPAGGVDPWTDPFQNVPLPKHVNVVHVQEPGSTDLDQRQTSIYSAAVSNGASPSSVAVPGLGAERAENPLESEILLFDIHQDLDFRSHASPTLAQGNIGSLERSVSPFSLLEDSEEKTSPFMAGDDKFSSSFYAVFSTTVSSLEDIADPEQGAGGTETRELTPVSQVDEKRSEDIIMDEDIERATWNEQDDIVGFGADDNCTTHLDETSGDDSVFDDIRNQQSKDELISFVDSMQSSERGDHSPCISKDILFQTKISVGSGDSSRGSISRESMKVNLSQDSSTLDQPDDLSASAPPSQSQPEPVVRRNFDVTAVLLPLAECSSTDSMLVNMSSDSLAVTNVKLRDSLSRGPDRGNRNTLSIDLRRRNMLEQTRRRSLPMIMLKNLGKNQPILWSSQSVDENIDVSHRRSSLPSDGPQLEEIQTFKSSTPKLQYENQKSGSVSSFTSFGKRSSVVENEPQKTVDLSGTKSSTTANEVVAQGVSVDLFQPPLDPWGSDISSNKDSNFENYSSNSLPWGDDDWAAQLSNPFGDDFVRQTVDVQPSGRSEEISKRKDVKTKDSIHEDISLITSIGTYVSALPDSENPNLRIESSKEPVVSPTHSSVFTSFVRNKLQNPLRAFGKFPLKSEGESGPTSFREIIAHADETVEYPKEVIFLEHIKEAHSKVNIAIPPDLVPYEEQYLEPMQCLREVSSESGLSDAACFDATGTAPEKVTPEDVGKESKIIKESPTTNRETDPTEKSSLPLQDGLVFETSDFEVHETTEINNKDSAVCQICDAPEEETNKVNADFVKADSSSDSDGGDIDALVMEYKQEVSESDDSDIDNIVMAFKVENPEQELQKAAEAEKHRRSAFNKFGKVLNKMQSVTKYMTTKKKDKEPDEKFKSPPTSGRHTRSQSQDEGAESTSPQAKLEQEDAFDLLNKAAEVFKEQTVRKKRTNPASVWRSKTLHTETVEPEAETDCDIVTRAAILFKGFKSKKVNDHDPGDLKAESEDQLSTGTNAILDSTSSEFAIKTDHGEEISSDPLSGSQTETQEHLFENLIEANVESDKMDDCPCSPSGFSDSAVHPEPPLDQKKSERVEEAGSAMGDSGFESVIRYAAEQQDACEEIVTFPSTLSENATETSVTSASLDMCRHDFIDFDVKDEPILTHTDTESKSGKIILDADVSREVMGTEATQGVINNLNLNSVCEEVSQPYCVDLDSKEAQQKDSKETVDVTLDGVPQRSMTVDSELEPESPKILGVLNEQTCDLILSTGYEEVKVGKKGDTAIASDKPDVKVKTRKKGHRDETNGKLEELAKEISLVEAAGYKDTTGSDKAGADMLDIRPPEYKRLSSESTENQDTMSLTVNCPDSPENGISDNGDGKFSLCCGGNFKIHLNCTAMVKKPERRPSAVIIANKRCAMTEEENMFPMKVSESYRAGLNFSIDKTDVSETGKMLKGPVAPLRMVQDLKVNEHELNRNFAGSREELLAEAEIKPGATDVKGGDVINKQEALTQTAGGEDLQKVTGSESVKTDALEEKPDKMGAEAERNKRVEKRRSILEELDANKETINMYDSVLDELMKRQGEGATGGKKEEMLDSSQGTKSEKSKRYGRVMSESEFDANFGEAIEKCEQKLKEVAIQQDAITVINEDMISDPTRYVSDHIITVTPRDLIPGFAMQQSMDVYDNVLYPDVGPPLPERSFRSGIRHVHDKRSARDPHDARSSFTSIVSDSATSAYMHGIRPQGRTKWVSSTPHLSTLDKRNDVITNRTNSFPYLDRSDNVVSTQYGGHVGSATSFNSDSACWGNYARIDDVHDRRSYDSESSTSGLVIPGAGRASTLSDVSDAYIFGEYSTVKDEIPYDRVIRPLNGHGHPLDNAFKFRHFPAAVEDSPYENIKVITSQPVGSHPRYYRSNVDVHGDVTSGFEHYAVIGQPMESKSVQYSGPSSPTGVMKISCASQTSTESLVGLVRDDASDILEGLPVFEYTLGATLSTHSHLADAAGDFPAMTRYSDDKPDLTKQTQSLDRRKSRQKSKTSDPVVKKQTKVTFSRDAVLTDVIDGIKKSEQGAESNSRGLRDIASSTISSIGGGVKEIAKIFHVPFQCCRSSRREKPKPSEPRVLRHSFRLYHFRRPHRCFVCKQLVYNQGSACQVCRYICHRKCELQVMTSCVPQVTNDLSNEAVTKGQQPSLRSVGQSSQTQSSMSSTMRDMLNKSLDQSQVDSGLSLDLVYITERIISMTFPSEGHDTTYSFHLKEVVHMLKTKHGDNYLILNLSEKRQDLTKANLQVKDYGWPDHLAPPLERLCSLCKAIDSWLNADVRNVVVLHCKGGRSRIASVIAAYMHYCNICASADQALDRFAMKRFYDEKLGGLPLPSQRRYVRYFSGLLSGAIKINSNPLYLHHILIHGVPNFDTKGGCRPFIKVYQGMQPIFTSGVYNVTDNMQKVCISISPGIPLRGDILIKCYHKKTRSGQREVIWQCQFHTCAISDNNVVFSKQELDDAVLDPRFPDNGKVEFVFGPSSDVLVSVSGFKSDVTVPVDDNEESLARSDSYENFHRALEAIDAVDINENGISSSQAALTKTQVSNVRNVTHNQVTHNQAPDGSLYATVEKRAPVQQPTAPHHALPYLTNGSISSSLDSGYTGHNASFNSHYTSVGNSNANNNVPADVNNPNYQSSSTLSRKTVQTLEERTQLDELLSDLLSEQAFVSGNQRSPRSFQTAVQSQQAPLSPSGGNVATSPTMSGAKTVTTTTRTFTSYSSTDAHRNPDRVLIQRAEVSYKVPGQGEVKDHYTIAADPTQMLDTSPTRPPPSQYHPKGVPNNAFSYTSGLSSQQSSQRSEVFEHEVLRSPGSQGLQSPPSSRLPYRTDYEQNIESSPPYSYSSPDGGGGGDTSSWLAQQQQKLKNFKEGRDSTGRTEQEKKLVNELRFAQNKYYTRRTQSDEEERAIMDSYNRQNLQNGPTSPERVTSSYAPPQRSIITSDAPWPQDQQYNTSYSTSSFMESRSYGDKRSNKPPPSPTMQRSLPAPMTSSAPAPVPARTSSKEYMRTRSNSGSSNWQQQQQQPPQQQKPLQRQQSDIIYDRNREVEHIQPRSYGSTHSTPPLSPRAISPVGPISTTTYTTYRTIDRQRDERLREERLREERQREERLKEERLREERLREERLREERLKEDRLREERLREERLREERQREAQEEMARAKRIQQQQAPPPQQPPTQINHHYITEVFVHRTDLNKDKADSSTRLDELEKNLEAASQSIKASKSSQQYATLPRQPQVFEETVQQHSQQYHTYQESKPEPPRVKEIEEDRIMLRPIGPGMQTLEPESANTGTLGRPTTPGFPIGPVGGQIISPTGTLQAAPIQQHQTVQYQQYHQSQTYQAQHLDGQGQNTLHIDTSPKMLISPSAGSPPSPGNFNTLRQQLSSAHSMSGSVISPGPHSMTGQSSPSVYFGLSRRGSLSSLADSDMVHTTPKFVKDTSKYWYKPNISREDAIQMLKDKLPGTFVIRDSNSFPGAFGLALKVATIPPNVQAKPSGDPLADLVRHFLIEPTPKGVRLRGCTNEPVFGSLAALVYQHSITPLALPCKLALPETDAVDGLIMPESPMNATELNSAATLLSQGAACNVVFINSVDMESLTGPQAVAKAVKMTFENLVPGRTTMVHFKVSNQGITLTDNNRKLFFRRHYPVSAVTYCGMDPQDRRWKREIDAPGTQGDARLFGFVARKQGSSNENSCHIFAELDPEQPASAIVNFVTKVMIGQSKVKS